MNTKKFLPLALALGVLCTAATIDVYLQPEVTTPDSGNDVIPVIKSGGGSGMTRKIKIGNLVPKPSDAGLTNDIWISYRTDGLAGDGTKRNPFDGSTQAKLDALMSAYATAGTQNLYVHLIGPASFHSQVDATTGRAHPWYMQQGWTIDGGDWNATTLVIDPKTGGTFGSLNALDNGGNSNCTVKNLTIDCNWSGLRQYAPASTVGGRTITVTATNGSNAVVLTGGTGGTDFYFGRYDEAKAVTATGFAGGTTITSVTDATHATLSNNFTGTTGSVSTVIGKGWNVNVSAVSLSGSNNTMEHVRAMNCYGNGEASTGGFNYESFGLIIGAPAAADGVNNVIRNCESINPAGNYGSPFAAFGAGDNVHWLKSSRIEHCYAKGYSNGHNSGYTTGGVNSARTDGLVVDGNYFEDCGAGAFYSDTDQTKHLRIINNTTIRSGTGANLSASNAGAWVKDDIEIAYNKFYTQARSGSAYGVYVNGDATTNLNVHNNIIRFTEDGLAMVANNWPVFISNATTVSLAYNTVPNQTGFSVIVVTNDTSGSTGVKRFMNRTLAGEQVPGLEDSEPAVAGFRITKTATGSSTSMRFGDTAGEIPTAGYNDLILRFKGRSTVSAASEQCYLTFNDDAGPYAYHVLQSYGSTAPAVLAQNNNSSYSLLAFSIVGATGLASEATDAEIVIPNYRHASLHKNLFGRASWYSSGASAQTLEQLVGMWKRSTVLPISTMQINLPSGNWASGSTFTLEAR